MPNPLKSHITTTSVTDQYGTYSPSAVIDQLPMVADYSLKPSNNMDIFGF